MRKWRGRRLLSTWPVYIHWWSSSIWDEKKRQNPCYYKDLTHFAFKRPFKRNMKSPQKKHQTVQITTLRNFTEIRFRNIFVKFQQTLVDIWSPYLHFIFTPCQFTEHIFAFNTQISQNTVTIAYISPLAIFQDKNIRFVNSTWFAKLHTTWFKNIFG